LWRDYGVLFHTTFVFSKAPAFFLLLPEPTLSLVRVLLLNARISLVRVAAADLVLNPDLDIRLQLEWGLYGCFGFANVS
jgi:hypothetical protein